jgi:hypothetical protein
LSPDERDDFAEMGEREGRWCPSDGSLRESDRTSLNPEERTHLYFHFE